LQISPRLAHIHSMPPTSLLLDIALRGAAVAVLLLLVGLLARDYRWNLAARLGAALAFGVAAYVICSAPGVAGQRGWWHAPLVGLASGNAVVLWLFARALFEDGFGLRPWHGLAWLAMAAGALLDYFLPSPVPLGGLLGLARLAFAALALVQSLASWRADLVEGRRRLRVFIVGAIALHAVVDAVVGPGASAGSSLASAAGLAGTTLLVAWPMLRVAGGELFDPVPAPAAAIPAAEPPDARLLATLQRLMTVERVHRREGLTIGALANQMNLPEYRLRRLINQGLGYRNFNTFLNHYRIDEAKQALADPAQAAVPVLTIALDAGFQSLGPFNRAFKAETGQTPSEYRRLHLVAAKPLSTSADFEISKTA
jgi:AraC-like DNA-binding protein